MSKGTMIDPEIKVQDKNEKLEADVLDGIKTLKAYHMLGVIDDETYYGYINAVAQALVTIAFADGLTQYLTTLTKEMSNG